MPPWGVLNRSVMQHAANLNFPCDKEFLHFLGDPKKKQFLHARRKGSKLAVHVAFHGTLCSPSARGATHTHLIREQMSLDPAVNQNMCTG